MGGSTGNKPPGYMSDFYNGAVKPYIGQIGSGNLNPRIPDSLPTYIGPNQLQDYGRGSMLNYYNSPSAEALGRQAYGADSTLLNAFGNTNPLFQGTSSLTPLLMDSFRNLLGGGGSGGGGSRTISVGGGNYKPMTQADIQGLIDATNTNLNTNFNQQTLPGVRSGAESAGMGAGSREAIAEGVARSNLNNTVAQTDKQIQFDADNAERNRLAQLAAARTQANASMAASSASADASRFATQGGILRTLGDLMGQGTQLGQAGLGSGLQYFGTGFNAPAAPGQAISNIGDWYQHEANAENNANIDRYVHNNSIGVQDLNTLGNLINGSGAGNYARSPGTSTLAGLLGTGAAAYGTYANYSQGKG